MVTYSFQNFLPCVSTLATISGVFLNIQRTNLHVFMFPVSFNTGVCTIVVLKKYEETRRFKISLAEDLDRSLLQNKQTKCLVAV